MIILKNLPIFRENQPPPPILSYLDFYQNLKLILIDLDEGCHKEWKVFE